MKNIAIFILAAVSLFTSCKDLGQASKAKAIFGINEGDCRIWDGTEDLGHCRKLLRNNDLVTYYKNWSGTTNFHTLNWWVYRVRDGIKQNAKIDMENLYVNPEGIMDLVLDSGKIAKDFDGIRKSNEFTCSQKIDMLSNTVSGYLFKNREIASDFINSYINANAASNPLLGMVGPLSNTLFSQPSEEGFTAQLNSLLGTVKAVKMDQKGCDFIASLDDSQGYKQAVTMINLLQRAIGAFNIKNFVRKGMRSWAKNQPSLDCRFTAQNGDKAYCQILRNDAYDLVFKLRRVKGLYSSKTESVYQMYKTPPVRTKVGDKPMNVCAFEWKVDKYIRMTSGPAGVNCFDRQTETLEKSIDSMENDPGVCFFDHKNFDGFKLCTTSDHSWIGHDMNDEISSIRMSADHCVVAYSNVDFNAKVDKKEPAEVKLLGLTQSEKEIRNLKNLGWGDKISSFKIGKVVDGSCEVTD